ncbi:hypothetical protein MBLNU459_g5034t2 [Dothideomycetes sp. NU459]
MKALGVLLTLTVMSASDAPLAGALILNKTLVPFTYDLLNIGEIEPRGWISDQLQLEANGLAGNLYNFYRYVKESTWLGGTYEYSELHESAPYWYNGLVPLAYLLKNDALQSQVDQFLDYVLGHQADDGWLGPETTRESRGIWARCLLLQGMMNHAIANPAQKQRIIPAMVRFVQLAHTMLQNNYTGYIQQPGDNFDPYGFGLARAHELSTSLQWLYEQDVGDAAASVIWDTMDLMWAGAVNAKKDWTKFFVVGTFPTGSSQHPAGSNLEHGVNLAEGALLYALDINALTTTTPSLNWTDQKPLASNQTYAHVHDHVITPVTNDSWAIAIDPSKIIVQEAPGDTLSSPVIAFDAPPVILSVAATRIQWNLSEGTADLPPIDPQPVGEPFWAKFVPYGSAKLHMAQLPTLNLTL